MKTAMVDARSDFIGSVAAAVEILNRKEVVALPTETVYGLAGDALEPEAVAKIFEAKERPSFDPLIIHIENKQWLNRLTRPSERVRHVINRLMGQFVVAPLDAQVEHEGRAGEVLAGDPSIGPAAAQMVGH